MSKDEIVAPILNAINDLKIDIRENRREIQKNREAIQRNSKEIQENKVAILSLTERFERFEMKYDKDYKEIYRIIDTFQRSTENIYEKHEIRIKKLECQY